MNRNIANNIKTFNLIIFFIFSVNSYAGTLNIPTTYATNGTVTASNLNGNFTAGAQVLNGGLDNTNANTTQGYRFYQTVSVLPSAGNQGAVYFLITDNTLNFDTGSSFIKSVAVSSPSKGDVIYYNGAAWVNLPAGTSGQVLKTNGAASNPAWSSSPVVPVGGIIIWSGTIATIPSNYQLCNGTNGTPDLRNIFVVGANADSGGVAKTTILGSAMQTGGSTTIDITQMPPHTHTVNSIGGPGLGYAAGGFDTKSATTGSAGSGQPYAQPFFALAYIERMS